MREFQFDRIGGHAVVVFSGGQDSTTCLYWALRVFDRVTTVTYDYGQRHRVEIDVAAQIAQKLGLEHHLMDVTLINQLSPSSLTRADVEVISAEQAQEGLSEGQLPSTFVPGRNMVFLSFAGILANQLGAKHLVTGVSQADYSGYPDCRADFVRAMNDTINYAMEESIMIHTPLMHLDKAETWALADNLGVLNVIREETLTCYNGIVGDGCGTCPSCFLRKRGLEQYLEAKQTSETL